MHFDDRLATVLRARIDGQAIARIQYRQLLDLLGTHPVEAQGPLMTQAYGRLAELSRRIPPGERAALIAEPGLRLRSARLIAALAGDNSQVAAAAIDKAQLGDEQWRDLVPALPAAARAHLYRRADLGAPVVQLLDRLGIGQPALPAAASEAEAPAAPPPPAPSGIGAIVKRIEAYRRARETPLAANDAPRLPLGEETPLRQPAQCQRFDFATDAAGKIISADPGVAPMVVGTTLLAPDAGSSDPVLATTARRRQPLDNVTIRLEGAPAIAGRWRCDGVPQFDALSGRFTGYAGRMRRLADRTEVDPQPAASAATLREADRIRQLLHELRTPVGAIQGFAEVIQQQLFGAVPHEYRALAATIAGDSARVLAAFEELERYAKLRCAAIDIEPGECDLAALVAQAIARIEAFSRQRGSGFNARYRDGDFRVAIAPIEAERIVWRLLATLAGTSSPNEVLALRLSTRPGVIRLKVELPGLLAARDDEALFGAAIGAVPQTIASGMFGVGFALRLARAEAIAAGGKLQRRGKDLVLRLPALTLAGAEPSEGDNPIADGAAAAT